MGFFKTALLMAAMTAIFMGLGYWIGGMGGALIALIVAGGMNVMAWWNSDKMVLRMHNAQPVAPNDRMGLHDLVRGLADNAGLPMPKVYLIQTDQPNAFATGRNPENAAVAMTTGILQVLSREELAGVLAHELAHIRNRDTLTMTITATFAGAITMLANLAFFFGGRERQGGLIGSLAMMILAPLAATLVQMAVSRTREYAADKAGAEICGNPMWLASALAKIDARARGVDNLSAEAHPETAHMFIINPLHGGKSDNLFATHPATENRIVALREQAQNGSFRTAPARAAAFASPAPDHQQAAHDGSGPWSNGATGNVRSGRDKATATGQTPPPPPREDHKKGPWG